MSGWTGGVVVDWMGGVGMLMGDGGVEGMGGGVDGSVCVDVGGVMDVECTFGGGFEGGAGVCIGCEGCVDEYFL